MSFIVKIMNQPQYLLTLLIQYYSAESSLMDYGGPGFFAVVSFSFCPLPSPISPVSKLNGRQRETNCWREGEGRTVYRGVERSQILRRRENLVLYTTLNTLCHRVAAPWKERYSASTFIERILKNFSEQRMNSPFLVLSALYCTV